MNHRPPVGDVKSNAQNVEETNPTEISLPTSLSPLVSPLVSPLSIWYSSSKSTHKTLRKRRSQREFPFHPWFPPRFPPSPLGALSLHFFLGDSNYVLLLLRINESDGCGIVLTLGSTLGFPLTCMDRWDNLWIGYRFSLSFSLGDPDDPYLLLRMKTVAAVSFSPSARPLVSPFLR